MTADATDPNPAEGAAPERSAAPPFDDAGLAPVPVESEGLADLLSDPQIAPAEDSAELADLLATPQEATAVDETPGLAALLAEPDPAVFGEATAPTDNAEPSPEPAGASMPEAEPPPASIREARTEGPVTGLPPLPALTPERPGPTPGPLAPEAGSGGYLGLIIVIVLVLVALLVGAIVLIAVLVANAAWPFPIAAAALPTVLPL